MNKSFNIFLGCYIGQELTARTYHTGVIRKRIMPIRFEENVNIESSASIKPESVITTDENKKIGKFRNGVGCHGIALLRIEDAFKANKIIHEESGIELTIWKPSWWPKEVNKEESASVGNQSL